MLDYALRVSDIVIFIDDRRLSREKEQLQKKTIRSNHRERSYYSYIGAGRAEKPKSGCWSNLRLVRAGGHYRHLIWKDNSAVAP